jgi:hypothetical protein
MVSSLPGAETFTLGFERLCASFKDFKVAWIALLI